jgi:hypothetical protein
MPDTLERPSDLSPIIHEFGTWAVTHYGVESLTTPYAIEWQRVHESDWVSHMAGKRWVDVRDFIRALDMAREVFPKASAKLGPRSIRFAVFLRDGFKCRMCGRGAEDGAKLEADHIKLKSHGGAYTIDNLRTLCKDCNRGRRDIIFPESMLD